MLIFTKEQVASMRVRAESSYGEGVAPDILKARCEDIEALAESHERLRATLGVADSTPDSFASQIAKLRNLLFKSEQERGRLVDGLSRARAALSRDKTGLGDALGKVVKYVDGASWIVDGRGPYAWNDDRYKKETGVALRAVKKIAKSALHASGDIADAEVRAADDVLVRAKESIAELDNETNGASDMRSNEHSMQVTAQVRSECDKWRSRALAAEEELARLGRVAR
jgi:hypothetical protein